MGMPLDLPTLQPFAIALLIGALLGLEREKHRARDADASSPGLRTFIVVAEIGAVAGWLAQSFAAPWVLGVAVAVVGLIVAAGYVMGARTGSPALGLTSEVAAVLVCLLGALATMGQPPLAIALAVVTAAVLAYKQPLHGVVGRLGWDDLHAGLRLLIAAFIVLPILPDRALDPWGALNPASLWRLVLLISGLSLVGYVATRWLGERKGRALTGITGGLVSSTAVTLSFARESRNAGGAGPLRSLAGGMLLAWAIMFVRVLIEVFAVNPPLVARVAVPFAAMAGVAGGFAAWLAFRRGHENGESRRENDVPLKNPFSLTSAARFAVFFAIVLVVVKVAQQYFHDTGLYVVAALAGLTDVDAITLSMAGQARSGDATVAVRAIVIAALTNTLVKGSMACVLGGRGLRRHVIPATISILAAGLVGLWLAEG